MAQPRFLVLTFALSSLGLGCATNQSADASTTGDVDEAGSKGPAAAKHGGLPNTAMLEGSHGMHAPNTAGLLRGSQSGETSYDASAPATVLITTRWGHGSGVIVDPRGLVLTNYHVIAGAHTEDLQFRVEVTTVEIQKNGSVLPGPKYDAVALKIDPKRDLALLRLTGAPTDLPAILMARADPKPGRRVAAIGNAGVGFGWAVKHCSINAIGTLESRAAALVQLGGETWSEQEREQMTEVIAKAAKEAGLQIQTDCTILPGDSGGPLIDDETHELVGLNVSVNTAVGNHAQAIGSVAYHIHVAELRDFMTNVPGQPATWAPDPWEVAGYEGTLADSDGDGEFDSLLVTGTCSESMTCQGLFADVDQNSFPAGQAIPSLAEIYDRRALEAELIAINRPRLPRAEPKPGGRLAPVSDQLVYLDRDGDGVLDSLLVRDGETNEVRGFKGLASGNIVRDPSLDGREQLTGDLFDDPAIGKRVERFADMFDRPSHDPRAPIQTSAIELVFDDADEDGKSDTLYAQTRLDVRMLIDADQDSIAGFADNAAASKALAAGTIDAEFMAVNGAPMRVWYDTNDDNQFDLLLVGASIDRGVVVEATSYTPDGTPVPAPVHLGRKMLRPGLLANPEQALALERMFSGGFPQAHASIDDGLSSFPSIAVQPGASVSEVADSKNSAAQVVELDRVLVFADLDRDTFKPKDMKTVSLTDAIVSGRFDAEFAYVYDGIMAWSFYDSDNDGSFDVVLVSRFGDPLHAEEEFSLAAKLEWGTPTESTPMFDSGRITNTKQRAAFKTFAGLLLDPAVVSESR